MQPLVINAHSIRRGCLLCNAAIDQAPTDKSTEELVMDSMNRIKEAITFVVKDKEKAEQILASYFGARVLVKAGMEKRVLETIRDQTILGL